MDRAAGASPVAGAPELRRAARVDVARVERRAKSGGASHADHSFVQYRDHRDAALGPPRRRRRVRRLAMRLPTLRGRTSASQATPRRAGRCPAPMRRRRGRPRIPPTAATASSRCRARGQRAADTVPAKLSGKNAADDKLITVAYTFKKLTDEERRAIYQGLKDHPPARHSTRASAPSCPRDRTARRAG